MIFDESSGLVKVWVRQIRSGRRTIDDVPKLANLPEMVATVIQSVG
jgi:hypothetical protein